MNGRGAARGTLLATALVAATVMGVHGARAAGNPMATGGGTIITPAAGRVTFGFTAIQHQDRNVRGQLEFNSRIADAPIRIHAELDRIAFHHGNQATVSGTITQVRSSAPGATDLVGRIVVFTVQDNGEGSKAPPDRTSEFKFFPAGSGVNCHNYQPPLKFPVQGNIQVRPGEDEGGDPGGEPLPS
jgi:hypothetical protein